MDGTENPPADYWKPEKKCMIKKEVEEEYDFGKKMNDFDFDEKMKNDPPESSVKTYFSVLDR